MDSLPDKELASSVRKNHPKALTVDQGPEAGQPLGLKPDRESLLESDAEPREQIQEPMEVAEEDQDLEGGQPTKLRQNPECQIESNSTEDQDPEAGTSLELKPNRECQVESKTTEPQKLRFLPPRQQHTVQPAGPILTAPSQQRNTERPGNRSQGISGGRCILGSEEFAAESANLELTADPEDISALEDARDYQRTADTLHMMGKHTPFHHNSHRQQTPVGNITASAAPAVSSAGNDLVPGMHRMREVHPGALAVAGIPSVWEEEVPPPVTARNRDLQEIEAHAVDEEEERDMLKQQIIRDAPLADPIPESTLRRRRRLWVFGSSLAFIAVVLGLSLGLGMSSQGGTPYNDECVNAIQVADRLPFMYSGETGSAETSVVKEDDRGAWFQITGSATRGTYIMSATGMSFRPKLAVYEGSCDDLSYKVRRGDEESWFSSLAHSQGGSLPCLELAS